MSEFDDLIADVSEREGPGSAKSGEAEGRSVAGRSRSETSVIKTTEDVVRVLAERGKEVVAASAPSDLRPPSPRSARTQKKKVVEKGDGRCGAYAPRGTKCKLCGKIHP